MDKWWPFRFISLQIQSLEDHLSKTKSLLRRLVLVVYLVQFPKQNWRCAVGICEPFVISLKKLWMPEVAVRYWSKIQIFALGSVYFRALWMLLCEQNCENWACLVLIFNQGISIIFFYPNVFLKYLNKVIRNFLPNESLIVFNNWDWELKKRQLLV